MKVISLSTLIATGLCLALVLAACEKPEEKVKEAKNEVAEANQDLKEATREVRAQWQEDWLKFKRDSDEEIAINERRIIQLRKEVNDIDTRYRAKYTTLIDDLERRNNERRDRVNNYKDEGDERWEQFKKDMQRETDDLKSSLGGITIKNS